MAPGPANKGNANGTTPDSSDTVPPNLQPPCVSNSIETTKSNIPPAIIKLEIVIPKIDRICVPTAAKIINKAPAVITVVFITVLRSFFCIFCVMFANKGIIPIGLITTKRAIVDLKRSSPKIFKKENKSSKATETTSGINAYSRNLFVIKIPLNNQI